jgi:protein TonB
MRLYTIFLSIAAHAAVLVVVVIAPLAAMDALPPIHVVTEFIPVTKVQLPELPPPPRQRTLDSSSTAVNTPAAPTVAPDKIGPELPELKPVSDGPPGIPEGDAAGVAVIGPTLPISPTPAAVTKPFRPGGDIRPPAKTKHVAPVYPTIARQNGVQGTVMLEAVINEAGRVRDVRVIRSIPLLDAAAIDAVRQWEFTPTLLNGQAVPVLMTVTVSFQLR